MIARPKFFDKTKTLSTVARNASCSRGWLRLVVQSIFAAITVASFIMIVIMALRPPAKRPALKPVEPPRCFIYGCRVVCEDTPYYGRYEEDIIFTVREADTKCDRVTLELNTPYFENSSLPDHWLSSMRSNIHQLSIIDGNLKHISAGAFMSQFTGHIQILIIEKLQIESWESTSLVGMSSLRTLSILNCRIVGVEADALKAIDDTLEILTITESGFWDPANVTGSKGFDKLAMVDFSYNDFNHVLGSNSFIGLENTRILYLNSCNITTIGAGAFDFLLSIEVIYLNNNRLVTIPPGLFDTVIAIENTRPRIHLQDNFWYCDCSIDDLRQLVQKELLLVETSCTYPDELNSITFTEFEYICKNGTNTNTSYDKVNIAPTIQNVATHSVEVDGSYCNCSGNNNTFLRILSPKPGGKCSSKTLRSLSLTSLNEIYEDARSGKRLDHWLKFSLYMNTDMFSVVQLGSEPELRDYGLVFFQSTCLNELFCVDVMPTFLRVYNMDVHTRYTFCPLLPRSGNIDTNSCVQYDRSYYEEQEKLDVDKHYSRFNYFLYCMTVFLCLFIGALIVYGLIRSYPTLLKGSNRILFVKHKNVEALVLPPKLPLRNDFNIDGTFDFKKQVIFTIPQKPKRMKSVRSNKSGSPSYISAMQPTEDQLAEWRIRHHFNNDLTVQSIKSERSTMSWIYSESCHHSINESDRTYESLK